MLRKAKNNTAIVSGNVVQLTNMWMMRNSDTFKL